MFIGDRLRCACFSALTVAVFLLVFTGCRNNEDKGRILMEKKAPDVKTSTANLEKANEYFRKAISEDTNNVILIDKIVRNDLKICQNSIVTGTTDPECAELESINRGIARLLVRQTVDYELVSSVLDLSSAENGGMDSTVRSLTSAIDGIRSRDDVDRQLVSAEVFFLIGKRYLQLKMRNEARQYFEMSLDANNRVIDLLEDGNQRYGANYILAKICAAIAYNYRLQNMTEMEIAYLTKSAAYAQKSAARNQNMSQVLYCLLSDYTGLSAAYVRLNQPQKASVAAILARKYSDLTEAQAGRPEVQLEGRKILSSENLTREEWIGLLNKLAEFLSGKKFSLLDVEFLETPTGKTFFVRYRVNANGRWKGPMSGQFAYSALDGQWMALSTVP